MGPRRLDEQCLAGDRIEVSPKMCGALDREHPLLGRLHPEMAENRQVETLKSFPTDDDPNISLIVLYSQQRHWTQVGMGAAIHLTGAKELAVTERLDQNIAIIRGLSGLARFPSEGGAKAGSHPKLVRPPGH